MTLRVDYFPTLEQGNRRAATLILAAAWQAVRARGVFSLVLAGGGTPRRLYSLLATEPLAGQMPWLRIHVFWGDERWLPADHPHSNFAMAHETLLGRVGLPAANIHPMNTGLESPAMAAVAYEDHLRDFFAQQRPAGTAAGQPLFDCVLLGMGKDGHTASLFPGSPLLAATDRWVAAVDEPRGVPMAPRLTLTVPLFNRADRVLFLIAGRDKKDLLQRMLDEPRKAASRYPAARIQPIGDLQWLVAD